MLLQLVFWQEGQQLPGLVLMAGKLTGWGLICAIHPGKLIHVIDDYNGASFLLDTGSSYSS